MGFSTPPFIFGYAPSMMHNKISTETRFYWRKNMKSSSQNNNSISLLEAKIKYNFKDEDVIFTAITHSSYANERKAKKLNYNERIEFLGDSILSLVISEYLYKMYPNLPEGELTVTRAKIVCENSLSKMCC